MNIKNNQPGPKNVKDCFNFISRAGRPIRNNNIESGFTSIRSGSLSVQPGYNMTSSESNNTQLVRCIFRTGNTIQVLHYLFNTQSGRHKRQSFRNYKKRLKEGHTDNSESKQMNYVRLYCAFFVLYSFATNQVKRNAALQVF